MIAVRTSARSGDRDGAGCRVRPFVGIGASIWAVYEKLFGSGTIQGWTTIMIAVSLGSAAQLLMTGILGEYVGRVYEEVKRRPLYLVGEEINLQPPERD